MYSFTYHRPSTVRQAINLLSKVEDPKLLARGGVESKHFAPGRGEVHDTVDDNGRRFLDAMSRVQVVVPCELELADILRIDPLQRTEPLLVIGAPVSHPVAGFAVRRADARGVHRRFGDRRRL